VDDFGDADSALNNLMEGIEADTREELRLEYDGTVNFFELCQKYVVRWLDLSTLAILI